MKNNTTTRKFTKLGLAVATTFLAVSANAASFDWDFANTAGLAAQSFVETSLVGGTTITMSAYSTASYASTPGTTNSSLWVNALFNNQGGLGVGMTNSVQGFGSAESLATAPEHAVDSIGARDIIVLDAGVGKKLDWTSFKLGWSNEGASSTGNNLADLQAFTSGTQTGTLSFNGGVCFTGCGATKSLDQLGFTSNTYNNVVAGNDITIDNASPNTTLAPSRYLVLSGNISQTDDAFKLLGI